MPLLPSRRKPADEGNPDYEIVDTHEASEAAWAAFEDEAAWKRSRKGNRWRIWEGRTVTIFRRDDESPYHWCIAGRAEEGQQFSPATYDSLEEAVSSLAEALGVGE